MSTDNKRLSVQNDVTWHPMAEFVGDEDAQYLLHVRVTENLGLSLGVMHDEFRLGEYSLHYSDLEEDAAAATPCLRCGEFDYPEPEYVHRARRKSYQVLAFAVVRA